MEQTHIRIVLSADVWNKLTCSMFHPHFIKFCVHERTVRGDRRLVGIRMIIYLASLGGRS